MHSCEQGLGDAHKRRLVCLGLLTTIDPPYELTRRALSLLALGSMLACGEPFSALLDAPADGAPAEASSEPSADASVFDDARADVRSDSQSSSETNTSNESGAPWDGAEEIDAHSVADVAAPLDEGSEDGADATVPDAHADSSPADCSIEADAVIDAPDDVIDVSVPIDAWCPVLGTQVACGANVSATVGQTLCLQDESGASTVVAVPEACASTCDFSCDCVPIHLVPDVVCETDRAVLGCSQVELHQGSERFLVAMLNCQ